MGRMYLHRLGGTSHPKREILVVASWFITGRRWRGVVTGWHTGCRDLSWGAKKRQSRGALC